MVIAIMLTESRMDTKIRLLTTLVSTTSSPVRGAKRISCSCGSGGLGLGLGLGFGLGVDLLLVRVWWGGGEPWCELLMRVWWGGGEPWCELASGGQPRAREPSQLREHQGMDRARAGLG
jgi:hypothetical protein